jgi:anthraniloyl-CoA monooxygenase
MKVVVVGAGPAGLAVAALLKEGGRCRTIKVVERAAAHQAPGWGITLRHDSLPFLGLDESLAVQRLDGRALWYRGTPAIDLPYPHDTQLVTASRAELLGALRERCRRAGAEVEFGTPFATLSDATLAASDLIVAADGAHSSVRRRLAAFFGVTVQPGRNWYAWVATTARVRKLSIFVGAAPTPLVAWAYEYAAGLSTLVVECTDSAFRRLNLAAMTAAECAATIAQAFEKELGGHPVLTDTPIRWQRFGHVTCARLFHQNVVLVGDAAHTTHFSQGFGTAFAFDDAVALDAALAGTRDLTSALETYEQWQRPKIDRFQKTAMTSMEWAESLAEAAERDDDPRLRTLIAARWPNNEVTASPFSRTGSVAASEAARQ